MDHDCDIAIIGAGPVGLLLYRSLRGLPYRLRLIERRPQLVDDKDTRSYILNRALIERLCESGFISLGADDRFDLDTLIVSSEGSPVKFRVKAPAGGGCLKHVILAHTIQRALAQGIEGSAEALTGVSATQITQSPDAVELLLQKGQHSERLRCRIAIVADGARSPSAQLMGIEAKTTAREHSALVLSLESDRALPNQAEQCLTRHGPISLVPRIGEGLSGIIVSTDAERQKSLARPAAIDELMAQCFRGRYGRLRQTSQVSVFPIQPLRRPLRCQRALLIGDASCALSPVAAQGLSLGMDSALELGQRLRQRQPRLDDNAAWDEFCHDWQQEYQRRCRMRQELNQLYARIILNLGAPARLSLAPIMALLGLSPQLRRQLVSMLSD